VGHDIRREPEAAARQAMIEDLFATQTHRRMVRNESGLRQWYQLLLWLSRIYRWRSK